MIRTLFPFQSTRLGLIISLAFCLLGTTAHSETKSAFNETPFVDCNGGVVNPAENDWRLIGTGDIVFSDSPNGNQEAFRSFLPIFKNASVVIGNLEGAITNELSTHKKYIPGRSYAFRFPPDVAKLIQDANFNVISTANNHSNDYGKTGQIDTQLYLSELGIQVTGLKGTSAIVNAGKLRVAVVAATHYPVFNNVLELDAMSSVVTRLRQENDAVVVFYQLGGEGDQAALLPDGPEIFLNESRGDARVFAQRMQAAGASLLIGHGPHVLRAAECIDQTPVFHSIGNFVSAGGLSTRNLANVSILPEVLFDAQGNVRGVRAFPVTFSAKRFPVLDSTARGISLINALSQRETRRRNNFKPLLLATEAAENTEQFQSHQSAFRTWLASTSLKSNLTD